ncbi:coxsackievirus and adenovirus receptor homolog isoform X2 [Syngnathoides biaculeatus]|uniref:coxsackievirus and adenovirus receptor homolog isoform X2 n=1 Tax=Syngnathoides biaculeatus TaxID=300417 RepID=UPI002ADE000C|nr:coxsackievirus and adenovirus receptor homolog isoform X2 [Syngnathoides biaculeatus]
MKCLALVGVHCLEPLEKLTSVYKATIRCILWYFVLMGVLCSSGPARALEITMNSNHYHTARGSNVKLACSYTHNMTTTQYTEITWSIVSVTEDERHVIWFTDGHLTSDMDKALKGRVRFTSSDPTNGDASIIIKDVRLSDSGSYRCFVKKLPDLDFKSVDLTVMELPSQPQCSAGREFAGSSGMTLRCRSSHDNNPLRYAWTKASGNLVMPPNAVVDPVVGTLRMDKISERDCGIYRCTVKSMVNTNYCDVVLKCPPLSQQHTEVDSPQPLTTSAVSSIAVLVTLSVLGLVAGAAVFFWRRKKTFVVRDDTPDV